MSVQIAKHDEVVIVQVPGSWTIRDIRLEQSRVHRWTLKQGIPAKVVVVGGGPETAAITVPRRLTTAVCSTISSSWPPERPAP